MDELKLEGQNLGRVLSSRSGRACLSHVITLTTKQPNLELKIWPKQLLESLPSSSVLADHNLQL
jgi:hypothetical protein